MRTENTHIFGQFGSELDQMTPVNKLAIYDWVFVRVYIPEGLRKGVAARFPAATRSILGRSDQNSCG